ncbi:hypothetical protein [Streptomyces sp. NBC_01768]|uniref:hypothetical protein n=1 Tax=Streptomyces sp. NBC_01768 TaxID=2975938 RepID=UPI002DDAE6D9|nr:hypothetical protein [Streptomyces sp. NBC_01768]WSC25672.1 hypothetical protein OG902_02765 [Streptomyces sp. NBC_01768]
MSETSAARIRVVRFQPGVRDVRLGVTKGVLAGLTFQCQAEGRPATAPHLRWETARGGQWKMSSTSFSMQYFMTVTSWRTSSMRHPRTGPLTTPEVT